MAIELSKGSQGDYAQKVYSGGYSFATTEVASTDKPYLRGRNLEVVVSSKGRREEYRAYCPLLSTPTLYRNFAGVDYNNPEAVLAFINTYGFLHEDDVYTCGLRIIWDEGNKGAKTGWYEPLLEIQLEIHTMRTNIEYLQAIRRRNPYEIACLIHGYNWFIPQGYPHPTLQLVRMDEETLQEQPLLGISDIAARLEEEKCPLPPLDYLIGEANTVLSLNIHYHLGHSVTAFVDHSIPLAPRLRMQPRHLLGAMYLQLAQDFTGEKSYRKCEVCDVWFEVGNGPSANKATRVYCGDACKLKAYRKRKKAP